MSEDPNNLNLIVPDPANTSELHQNLPTVDTDAAIAELIPDIYPGDPTIEEPESTKTTEDSSSMSKQQEDSKNPLFTKVIAFLELLGCLSNLIDEDRKEKGKLTEELNNRSIQNHQLTKENERLEMEVNNSVKNAEYYRKNNIFPISGSRYNKPNYYSNSLESELRTKVNSLEQQLEKCQQSCQKLQTEVSGFEIRREKFIAELASLKQNTGTHYDATSSSPQHHELIDEYKNLKEQHLDKLADSLYKLMRETNPEVKDLPTRKEKINDIKAIISESILIYGQTIMREDRTSSTVPVTVNSQLGADENLSSQVEESQRKLLNPGIPFQYSTAGEWQEKDFKQAATELRDPFYSQLKLDSRVLDSKIQTEIEAAIEKILQFLNRAALAEPPANFQMIKKGASFDPVCHEAAKISEDAGKIVKTIYPAYLVNTEVKVRAIVLTEP